MADLQQLLNKTSRTFALAIPLLPEPTRTDVTLAYLAFRIVDTLEDAENLEPGDRIKALGDVDALLQNPSNARAADFSAKWLSHRPTANLWYQTLLANTPLVLEELSRREPPIQQLVFSNARRTAVGMASFLEQGTTRLRSMAELRRYCYFVAGIVGEMLTEIFAERIAGFSVCSDVQHSAQAFGEGLQLVNILKDADDDARCGRLFLPKDVERSAVFNLARHDLQQAQFYIDRLREAAAPRGYLAFTELPLQLAWATLDCVERHGPGSKVPREQLAQILANATGKSLGKLRSAVPSHEATDHGTLRTGISSS